MSFPIFEYLGLMLAFGVVAIMPGADFAMVLKQSIRHGRRPALLTAAGVSTSILVHGSYTLLGIGVIVAHSILVFDILKFAGAAYLVWIGIDALRADTPMAPEGLEAEPSGGISDRRAFLTGLLTNLLNPKAVLFFLALFTSLVNAHTALAIKAFYVGSMSAVLFAWFALVSVFFSTRTIRQGFYKLGRWFNRITGVTFILMAVRVAVARQSS